MIHQCDCVIVVNAMYPGGDPVITLTPGASRVITIQDWGCSGHWIPPAPGSYQVTYRVLVVTPGSLLPLKKMPPEWEKLGVQGYMKRCRQMLLSKEYWEHSVSSPKVLLKLGEPIIKKVKISE